MIKPYYQDDLITLYHGDCQAIISELSFDVIVSDPPYGIDYDPQSPKFESTTESHEAIHGDAEPFNPAHLLALGKPTVLWGGNCFASQLPDHSGWLAWDKVTSNGMKLRIAEAEFAWTNCVNRTQVFRHLWSGAYRASERKSFVHPTQKPVSLMMWVLGLVPPGLVLDPYMGSGPTMEAALKLGRRGIGIEIEERYCEIAVKRLSQGVFDLV